MECRSFWPGLQSVSFHAPFHFSDSITELIISRHRPASTECTASILCIRIFDQEDHCNRYMFNATHRVIIRVSFQSSVRYSDFLTNSLDIHTLPRDPQLDDLFEIVNTLFPLCSLLTFFHIFGLNQDPPSLDVSPIDSYRQYPVSPLLICCVVMTIGSRGRSTLNP